MRQFRLKQGIVSKISQKLSSVEPERTGLRLAAVAVIIKNDKSPGLLFIKRADRRGDPWSGQVAFPGGKRKDGDATARETAARETLEEVGIDLNKSARFLGYAESAITHTGSMKVVPAVYVLTEEVAVHQNNEVASHRWIALRDLVSPASRSSYHLDYGGQEVEMPALAIDGFIVWGLTHRILSWLLPELIGPRERR